MTTAPQPRCLWCGQSTHGDMACPRVKAFEFFQNGTVIRRVEFKTPAEIDFSTVLQVVETLRDSVKSLITKVRALNGEADDEAVEGR
jgi:hypothetical protein